MLKKLLVEFEQLTKKEKIQFIDYLLSNYTLNQTMACRVADTNVQVLLKAVKQHQLSLVHLYDNGRNRIHRIYYKDEIISYAKDRELIRQTKQKKYRNH